LAPASSFPAQAAGMPTSSSAAPSEMCSLSWWI